MSALTVDIDAVASLIAVAPALDYGSNPAPFTIDSEAILATGGDGSTTISILRGQNGTTPATHTQGTSLVAGWYTSAAGIPQGGPLTADLDTAGFVLHGTDGGTGVAGETLQVRGGTGNGVNQSGGRLRVFGGDASGAGGPAEVRAGDGDTGQTAGTATVQGGDGNGGAADGAKIQVQGGGGDGTPGLIILTGVPTSDPAVAGALYTTAGALMVSAG